jgi:hypothetical protein
MNLPSLRMVSTAAAVLLLLAGCATKGARPGAPAPAVATGRGMERLERLLSGSFSSAKHAAEEEGYFDIRLHMAPVWTGRSDGPWIYVEQARADSQDKPYRQRVYRLVERAAGGIREYVSEVYELPGDPLAFAGTWREPSKLASLEPSALVARSGCEVVLRETDGGFEGSTVDRSCPSSHRGASYATSEVRITAEGLVTWDRGFDAGGAQVWGAERGGYRFLRE